MLYSTYEITHPTEEVTMSENNTPLVELDDTLLEKVTGGALGSAEVTVAEKIDCGSCSHTMASADDDAAFNQ